ncbi:MAG: RNA polymerase sigma-70 factor [Prevotellaceae bacterium]|jgi:RNA polymerase sigma-70 factor (ECF subfamily)|nr:RNA polymerase sigma-70 factor [Prevotellaceae bacterium]
MNTEEHLSFDTIYNQLYGKALRFTISYVHDVAVAEDIVADALVALWLELKERTIDRPDAFLLTVLRNRSLDYLKHQVIRTTKLTERAKWDADELNMRIALLEACDPNELFAADIRVIVQDTLRSLPAKTRRIFLLSRQGHRMQDIAERMNLSSKAIEYHLNRAIKQLRRHLKDYL